jgi:poly(hydroxyalkanoate) depolymerase family esterase
MNHTRTSVLGGLALGAGLLVVAPAQAASLQKVNDWGASGVPSTASMYIYVPDKLATKPPILVLAHYCGGTASAVFGQAQGIVKAADQYGFIMVVPQTSNNCWDVGSTKSLTHDGGGDTQAVAQMVKYALTKYSANADRVYITGDSSGGMMTEAMLAVYPDVFKGGSAFAGVPAGCWAAGDPDGSWSNQCAGGMVTHTAQEWGDLVRGMDKGYTGHRPRVQLFHGDADPTINFKNHTEAIKQWTNVLGLSTEPTSTSTVTLGSHQATRQQWQDACGYVVLDAFTSKGGDHGPSDAIFNASFVVPFLGLDKTDAVDPELAQCGAAGTGGTGGMGGATSAGGAAGRAGAASLGGAGGVGSGGIGAGGQIGAAGSAASGGAQGRAGTSASGGSPSGGGTPGAAGAISGGGSGGAPSGKAGSGGAGSGAVASGTGGTTMSSAGAGGTTAGASPAAAGSPPSNVPDDGGCSCSAVGGKASSARALSLAFLALLAFRRRRPRTRG